MATTDTSVTLHPYFKVNPGKLDEFKQIVDQFVAKTRSEPKCIHYAFSFNGDEAFCREGYDDAAGLLAHLDNVGAIFQEALKLAQVTRFEVHAPASEIEKLRAPMAALNTQFWVLGDGFRR